MRIVRLAVLGLTLASCAAPVSGSPAPDPAAFELFDPCSIPADAVRDAGADPNDVVSSDYFGVEAPDWDLCTWDSTWYFLTLLSTTRTLSEIETNPSSVGFMPAQVGERRAVTYSARYDADRSKCDAAFAWAKGAIVVRIDTKGDSPIVEDPCKVAVRTAVVLDPVLPK